MSEAISSYCEQVLGQVAGIVAFFRRNMPQKHDERLEIRRTIRCRPDDSSVAIIAWALLDGSIAIKLAPGAAPLAAPVAIQDRLAALQDAVENKFGVRSSQSGQAGSTENAMSVGFKLPPPPAPILAQHPYAQTVLDHVARLCSLQPPKLNGPRDYVQVEARFLHFLTGLEAVGSTLTVEAVAADRVRYTLLVQQPTHCLPAYQEIIDLAPAYCANPLLGHGISPNAVWWDVQAS